jgi:hypothetical protein
MKKWIQSDHVWPAAVIISMIVFVAWMLGIVTIAVEHRPQLVTEHYYAEGSNLREWKARQAASEATGWQVQVRPLPTDVATTPLVELVVTDANGTATDSLWGQVAFYRPSDQSLDIERTDLQFVGAGRYLAKLPRPLEHGSWQAITHLERALQQMDRRISFFVES